MLPTYCAVLRTPAPRSNWVNDLLGQPFFPVSRPIDHGVLEALKSDIVPRLLKEVPGQPSAAELESDRYRALCDPVRPRRVQPGILQGDAADPPHRLHNRTGRRHAAHILRSTPHARAAFKCAQYGLRSMQPPACARGGQTSNIPAGAEEREKEPPTKMLGDAPLVKPAGDPHLASSRVDRALRRWIDLSVRDTRARCGSDRAGAGAGAWFVRLPSRKIRRFRRPFRSEPRPVLELGRLPSDVDHRIEAASAAQAPGSALAGSRDDWPSFSEPTTDD